jgi:cytochrome c
MKLSKNMPMILVVGVLLAGAGILGAKFFNSGNSETTLKVEVPRLSTVAEIGQSAFNANCASCHGDNGAGTKQGPPLIHEIYNPGHHGDRSFYIAVKNGVRQHHWPFGNMPAQPKVKDTDVAAIITFVREIQSANGIRYRRHKM